MRKYQLHNLVKRVSPDSLDFFETQNIVIDILYVNYLQEKIHTNYCLKNL